MLQPGMEDDHKPEKWPPLGPQRNLLVRHKRSMAIGIWDRMVLKGPQRTCSLGKGKSCRILPFSTSPRFASTGVDTLWAQAKMFWTLTEAYTQRLRAARWFTVHFTFFMNCPPQLMLPSSLRKKYVFYQSPSHPKDKQNSNTATLGLLQKANKQNHQKTTK